MLFAVSPMSAIYQIKQWRARNRREEENNKKSHGSGYAVEIQHGECKHSGIFNNRQLECKHDIPKPKKAIEYTAADTSQIYRSKENIQTPTHWQWKHK